MKKALFFVLAVLLISTTAPVLSAGASASSLVCVSERAPVSALNLDSADPWARDGITNAIENGYVPSDMQNDYTSIITRQDFCRLAISWFEYVLGNDIDTLLAQRDLKLNYNAFSDTDDPYILAAYALRITGGTVAPTETAPGLFNPGGAFDRQQAAGMILNVCRALGANVDDPPVSDFIDLDTAEVWARNGINFVRARGIMSGTSTDVPVFSPRDPYTRQQSLNTFSNILIHNIMPEMFPPPEPQVIEPQIVEPQVVEPQVPGAPTPGAPTPGTPTPGTPTPALTEQYVYDAMIALKADYPEGMPWTNANYYAWNGRTFSGGFGCVAFAFILSDAAFGDLKARTHEDFGNIRVGDILRVNNDSHSVIVLSVDASMVTIAEGNYNGAIHWGRTITRARIWETGTYVMTRYP